MLLLGKAILVLEINEESKHSFFLNVKKRCSNSIPNYEDMSHMTNQLDRNLFQTIEDNDLHILHKFLPPKATSEQK